MRVSALLLLAISLAIWASACRGDGGAMDSTSTSVDTGTDDGADGPCVGEWESFVETLPLYQVAYGRDDLFILAGANAILSWDPSAGWRTQPVELVSAGAVWASAPEDVYVAGLGVVEGQLWTGVMHWDGGELEPSLMVPEDDAVLAVHGTSPSDVWAVGQRWCPQDPACEALVFHHDGDAWTAHDLPGVRGLSSVWARGADDVFVGGEQTLHFDGEVWEPIPGDQAAIVRMVGDDTRLYGHNDHEIFEMSDAGWQSLSVPGGIGDFIWTVAIADDGLWAHASYMDDQRLSRFADGAWSSFVLPDAPVRGVVGVGGRPWVGVGTPEPDLGHEVWEVEDIEDIETVFVDSSIGHVERVHGYRRDALYATVFNTERSGVAKLGANGWQWLVTDLWDVEVRDIQVDSSGGVWLAGIDYVSDPPPLLWRIQGDQAVPVDTPLGLDLGTLALWVGGADDLWLLGGDQAHHFDGASWLSVAVPADARRIESAGGHSYLWSVSTLYELRNGAWVPLLVADEQFVGFSAAGPLSLWAVERHDLGEYRIREFDGEAWTEHPLGTRGLCDVAARAPDDVHVSGYWQEPAGTVHGVLMSWDGSRWTSIDTPATHCADLVAVAEGMVAVEGGATYVLECSE